MSNEIINWVIVLIISIVIFVLGNILKEQINRMFATLMIYSGAFGIVISFIRIAWLIAIEIFLN